MGDVMKALVILNPFSGRWSAQERWPEAERALRHYEVDFDLRQTERSRHATELARDGMQRGYDVIIAAGGDGLIGEVVNGLVPEMPTQDRVRLGILPLGTANDLIDNLRLPLELDDSARIIAEGHSRSIDIIQVNEHYFINNGGLGLESYVSILQNQMTWATGMPRYVMAAMRGISANPQWKMQLEWDDGEYQGPVTLVSIANGARTGGVFYTVPHAHAFDGKLSFVYGYVASRREILQVFPMIMKPEDGNYTEHPQIHEVHATYINVHSVPGTPMHADGEVLSKSIQDLRYRILPRKIPLLMPGDQ